MQSGRANALVQDDQISDPSLKMLSLELRSLLCNLDRFLALDHDLDLIFEQQDSIEDIEEKILETVGFVGYS